MLFTNNTATKYVIKKVKPKDPTKLPKMYSEIEKNVQIKVNKINTVRFERAKDALINANMVIINPNNAKIATFLMGSDISIIMLAKRVTNITVCIPLSKPRILAIKPATYINITALTACPH